MIIIRTVLMPVLESCQQVTTKTATTMCLKHLPNHSISRCLGTLHKRQIKAYDQRILTSSPLEDGRRPPGCTCVTRFKTVQQDLKAKNLSLDDRHGSEQTTLETVVYIWRYELLAKHARKENLKAAVDYSMTFLSPKITLNVDKCGMFYFTMLFPNCFYKAGHFDACLYLLLWSDS